MGLRVLLLLLVVLLVASPILEVVKCQLDTSDEATEVVEGGDLGIVGDELQDFGDASFSPAPGVDTICVFPKNAARLVPAGEETELLVGVHNEGESTLKVMAIRASLHLPFDHHMFVQNLTVQEFYNASVPVSAQATFPYIFAVSKFLQPGPFDLVGTIVYEIDQQPHQSVFYNGTIEVVESGGFLSIESVFLVTLGAALVGFFGIWAYGQIQHFSKKTKRASKVEVGTGTTDANMDEWLQGTAYAQSLSNKSKKKK
ncbi:translocon-associated protein subunit alpha isoform X5 [Elaeis guineensis]|uniref:Translocon-associated protein subunit alpha n=1 Tax=Elaeis guineensis var. tenera TaxID=51953 RepID=A0A6J0PHI5_ELAGV|nr:translocon-associated protein subunit alpha isoform X2 [Elaeis guineensis]